MAKVSSATDKQVPGSEFVQSSKKGKSKKMPTGPAARIRAKLSTRSKKKSQIGFD